MQSQNGKTDMADANDTPTELNLETIVAKENDSISDDERNFLTENKDLLTDDEAKKFEVSKEPEKPPEPVVPETRFKAPEAPKAPEKPKESADDAGGDEDLFGDSKKTEKVLEEKLQPIQEQIQESRDIADVDGYIRSNPDFAKYREGMLTYLRHPAYRNIPVNHVATIVASKDLQKLGAQKERAAQQNANASATGGGNTARPQTSQPKDWRSASKEEFDAKTNEVLGRRI